MTGIKNKIIQANHGKMAPLKRLSADDKIIYYSPKTKYEDGEPLKAYTTIAEIIGENIYQVEITADFKPTGETP